MQTPWGEIEIGDAHAHLFSRAFFEKLAAELGTGPEHVEAMVSKLGWTVPPRDGASLASLWEQELDREGVAKLALMSSLPGDEISVAEVLKARPERFYGYFMFNPLDEDPVGRARQAFEDYRLQGLCLFPAMHRFSLDDVRLGPIFELAAQYPNVVVFVHTGVLTVGVRRKLGLRSRFDMRFSNPLDLHHVALDHPEINFVIPHFGAGFFREALMLGDLVPNVYMDTSSSNQWIRYLLPAVMLTDVFRKALEVYGVHRLLFGTDSSFFPRGWNREIFRTQVEALQEIGADGDTARAVLGENLRRLLERDPGRR